MNCCIRLTLWAVQQGFQIYDWLFPQPYQKVPHRVSAAKLPWLFVGVELVDGTILDKTKHVESLVDTGIPVTPRTVSSSIDPQLIKRCFYLNEKTLNEDEIPADGITIE
jgi:hypothetical protein